MKRFLLLIPILLTLTSCGLSNALQLFNIRPKRQPVTAPTATDNRP